MTKKNYFGPFLVKLGGIGHVFFALLYMEFFIFPMNSPWFFRNFRNFFSKNLSWRALTTITVPSISKILSTLLRCSICKTLFWGQKVHLYIEQRKSWANHWKSVLTGPIRGCVNYEGIGLIHYLPFFFQKKIWVRGIGKRWGDQKMAIFSVFWRFFSHFYAKNPIF